MFGIRMDVNSDLGMGHFSRCRCIADELISRGNDVFFICSIDTNKTVFDNLPYKVVFVSGSSYNCLNGEDEIGIIKELGITTLLIDSYYVNESYLKTIKKDIKIILLDDLCLFDYGVDAIINYNIEATNKMYCETKYNYRKTYTGTEYFPLRTDLSKYIKERSLKPNVEKVLIITGGTDSCGCVLKIIKAINPQKNSSILFYVLIGKYYSNLYTEQIRSLSKLTSNLMILEWGQEMGRLYTDVDLVIAPGSTIVYEALSLGTPCITFQFVSNQHDECVTLDSKKIADFAGDCSILKDDMFCIRLNQLFKKSLSYEYRKKQMKHIKGCFDGKGASRISEIMVELDNEDSNWF